MIIRCQNGRLLNTDHVVEWDKQTEEGEDNEEKHTVTARTVLDTSVEIFEGTQDECQTRLDTIYASLSEESTRLRHLCATGWRSETISWRRRLKGLLKNSNKEGRYGNHIGKRRIR